MARRVILDCNGFCVVERMPESFNINLPVSKCINKTVWLHSLSSGNSALN